MLSQNRAGKIRAGDVGQVGTTKVSSSQVGTWQSEAYEPVLFVPV